MTIKETVKANEEVLVAMAGQADACQKLTSWAGAAGFDNASAFSLYKKALKAINVDYNAIRLAAQAGKKEKLLAPTTITLYSDAKFARDRYAVCNQDGEVVWYGRFFESTDSQQDAELEAAKKAVWLASKVKNTRNLATINLVLNVDAEYLTWSNQVGVSLKKGGKARKLGDAAIRQGVHLTVKHIAGVSNPADKWTVADGYMRWQEGLKTIKTKAV